MNRSDMNVVVYCDLLLLSWLGFKRLEGRVRGYRLSLLDLRGVLQRHTILSLLLYLAWLNFMNY